MQPRVFQGSLNQGALENFSEKRFLKVGQIKERVYREAQRSPNFMRCFLGHVREWPSLSDLADTLGELTKFNGVIKWDTSKPDGPKRRVLNCERARVQFGFEARIPLYQGLKDTVDWWEKFQDNC